MAAKQYIAAFPKFFKTNISIINDFCIVRRILTVESIPCYSTEKLYNVVQEPDCKQWIFCCMSLLNSDKFDSLQTDCTSVVVT